MTEARFLRSGECSGNLGFEDEFLPNSTQELTITPGIAGGSDEDIEDFLALQRNHPELQAAAGMQELVDLRLPFISNDMVREVAVEQNIPPTAADELFAKFMQLARPNFVIQQSDTEITRLPMAIYKSPDSTNLYFNARTVHQLADVYSRFLANRPQIATHQFSLPEEQLIISLTDKFPLQPGKDVQKISAETRLDPSFEVSYDRLQEILVSFKCYSDNCMSAFYTLTFRDYHRQLDRRLEQDIPVMPLQELLDAIDSLPSLHLATRDNSFGIRGYGFEQKYLLNKFARRIKPWLLEA